MAGEADNPAKQKSGHTLWLLLSVSLISAFIIGCVLLLVRQYRGDGASAVIEKPTEIIAEAITLMRAKALQGERSDWPEIQSMANQIAHNNGGEREGDLDTALRYLVSKLEDGHSSYLSRAEVQALLAPATAAPGTPASIADAVTVQRYAMIATHGFSSLDPATELAAAQYLRALLNESVGRNNCGLLMDLRTNSGGNMYPMLSGLLPLLPEGLMLSFKSREGASSAVSRRGGEIWVEGERITAALESAPSAPVLPIHIAVLTGPQTGSSGEMVALAFKGRANTRFFGLPTAGVTSANQPFPLRHGGILNLATSMTLDRSGKPHPGPIQPDELIEAAAAQKSAEQAAAAWLDKSCK
ncbi:S41 family peptidase [Paucibacter sp. TC2R-5]|uniref:S41 family peptidase n=1 Tax=Paucibacter sp. TC2R-5 TaxID=2893555 RepID=UPI0021E48A0D|nr:S41 family peptidase [Paucibacter sp. TC2R-5]MCV2357886.1 S41 family peptidase [Paucibacter sp. TC2R-5]